MKSFGSILKENRLQRNLPLRKVAFALDIDPSVLSKIERGDRSANKKIIDLASVYFDLRREDLLNEFLSDQVATTMYEEKESIEILKIAEQKIKYLKSSNKK